MSVFRTATTVQQRIDPFKRVKYSLGLVLGVDEFEQEQGFFLERGRLHNRALHGYGTVYGLPVTCEAEGDKITVAPGLAIDPLGREIRVAQAQCAQLNEWLAANHPTGEVPANLDVYVLLSYRECETDQVPVPGAPCRSAEENIVPSRTTETFDLKFSLTLPNMAEEAAVEAFGNLLRRIEVTSEHPDAVIAAEQMAQQVRGLLPGPIIRPRPPLGGGLKPEPGGVVIKPRPGDVIGGVPGLPDRQGNQPIYVRPEQVEAVLEAAFRTWVTEVLPRYMDLQTTTAGGQPVEQAVLLARLACQFDGSWEVAAITVHEEERPYLLTTRLIQEYLINREQSRDHSVLEGLGNDDHKQYLLVNPGNRALIANLDAAGFKVVDLAQAVENGEAVPYEQAVKVEDAAGGDVGGTYPTQLVVQGIQGRPVSGKEPEKESVLVWNGEVWMPETNIGVKDHSLLLGLDKDDHKQYLRADGARALTGNLDANNKRIVNLPPSVAKGDPIVQGQGAGGDLAGAYPAPTVARLQGRLVYAGAPNPNDVLTWDGDQWIGRPAQGGGVQQVPVVPFVTIARIPGLSANAAAFRLWFHLNAGVTNVDFNPVIQDGYEVQVYTEVADPSSGKPIFQAFPVRNITRVNNLVNVFDLDLAPSDYYVGNLRFLFNLSSMKLDNGVTALDWFDKVQIQYLGFDSGEFVVAYWSVDGGADLSKPRVVAAGQVAYDGTVQAGNIQCRIREYSYGIYYEINFQGWAPGKSYAVKGVPTVFLSNEIPDVPPIFVAHQPDPKLPVRVEMRQFDQPGRAIQHSFMVEIAELPAPRQ